MIRHLSLAACVLFLPILASANEPSVDQERSLAHARTLYAERCATCHDEPSGNIPPRIFISTLRTPDEVVAALTTGVMRQQAQGLERDEIASLAILLTGRAPSGETRDPNANPCPSDGGPLTPGDSDWNGWGHDEANTRFHPKPGLVAADVAKLRPKWAFAYPGSSSFGQPVVVGGRVFTGGVAGLVFALDAQTGCTYWSYQAQANVRTAVVVERIATPTAPKDVAFFGGDRGLMHAVDARSGQPIWVRHVDEHPYARVFGTPKLYRGVLYVTVSSTESTAAGDGKYACCTFRGKVIALDPLTGRERWRTATIDGPFQRGRLKENGEAIAGPAGAAIFSSPTIDVRRGLLYAGTGNSYTNLAEGGSDAVHALALDDGRRRWVRQVLAEDAWIQGCNGAPKGNCPVPLGVDYGFGSSTILVERPHRPAVLLAPSKSGILYALDPDDGGRIAWQTPLARGSANGGILWGAAVADNRVFVGTSDYDYLTGEGRGDVAALDIDDGRVLWRARGPDRRCAWGTKRCAQTYVAALTAMPGVVFAGSLDGHIRAFRPEDGQLLWEFDVGGPRPAVNGGEAFGGGIDYGGQVVAGGMLFVQASSGRQPGNALIAFSVDGR